MCAHGLCPPPPHGEANNRGREDRGEKEGAVPVEQIGGVPRVSAAVLPLCCGWFPGAGADAGAEEVAAERSRGVDGGDGGAAAAAAAARW